MPSEIEVVEEVQPLKQSGGIVVNGNGYGEGYNGVVGDVVDDESLRNDVYTAAAHRDLEKLHRLVEYEGCSLSEPDGLGYYALQWAALNNRTAAAQYIIEITHVAAQYGQTTFSIMLFQNGMLILISLIMTGEPLHWAAYNGFADCICLLLFLDAHRGHQDKEGCTPLHWAAIKGNLEACTVLIQAGKKDLMVTDNGGLTPAQLASDKNHRQVAFFLGNARRLLEKCCDGNSHLGRLSKLRLSPVLWCIILLLLVTYTQSVIMARIPITSG